MKQFNKSNDKPKEELNYYKYGEKPNEKWGNTHITLSTMLKTVDILVKLVQPQFLSNTLLQGVVQQ